MNRLPEFAEEHSLSDKIRLIVIYLAVGAAVVLVAKTWLLPAIHEFTVTAHCREVLGFSGLSVLFYGLFVAMPLSVALLVGLTMGRHGYRVLRDGQLPPIGEKVFRPTRIERGRKAKLIGYVQMYSFLLPLAIAVWGLTQVSGLIASVSAEVARDCLDRPIASKHSRSPPNIQVSC
jgi:hypothetical protein